MCMCVCVYLFVVCEKKEYLTQLCRWAKLNSAKYKGSAILAIKKAAYNSWKSQIKEEGNNKGGYGECWDESDKS